MEKEAFVLMFVLVIGVLFFSQLLESVTAQSSGCFDSNAPGFVSGEVEKVSISSFYEDLETSGWKANALGQAFVTDLAADGTRFERALSTKLVDGDSVCGVYSFGYSRDERVLDYEIKLKERNSVGGTIYCVYNATGISDDLGFLGGSPLNQNSVAKYCPLLLGDVELDLGEKDCPNPENCRLEIVPGDVENYLLGVSSDGCGNHVVEMINDGHPLPPEYPIVPGALAQIFISQCSEISHSVQNCSQYAGYEDVKDDCANAGCCAIEKISDNAPFLGCEAFFGGANERTNYECVQCSDVRCIDTEPNNEFEEAVECLPVQDKDLNVRANIENRSDVDFLDLGPFSRGDKVIIDIDSVDGINTVAALFDENNDLIDANDDRSYYGGRLDPLINRVFREDNSHLYLGVALSSSAFFASQEGRFAGNYNIKLTREIVGENTIPQPRQQIVWLDFAGGDDVKIGMEPAVHMPPFNASAISKSVAGQENHMIDIILENMERDYADYNVVLFNSRDHTEPTEPHTSLFFGSFSKRYLGLADNVDTGNPSLVQEAIVFTETLRLFDNLQPTAEEYAQAVANVASHELGHLLGLEHTRDPNDLMATAATAKQVLEHDADFRRALLNHGAFPIGHQNSPHTLELNVGRKP